MEPIVLPLLEAEALDVASDVGEAQGWNYQRWHWNIGRIGVKVITRKNALCPDMSIDALKMAWCDEHMILSHGWCDWLQPVIPVY